MFEIVRSYPAPSDLGKDKYNTEQIVNALAEICHSKCYLCESDSIQEVEVEHFFPHAVDSSKKFIWENLFYSCKRCNRIKANGYLNLLDPCKPSHKVFRNIHLIPPTRSSDNIQVRNICLNADPFYDNAQATTELLERCFNDVSTAARKISRFDLINKILNEVSNILEIRAKLLSKRLTDFEKNQEIERLQKMTSPDYPFSAFWRWYVLEDDSLNKIMSTIISF